MDLNKIREDALKEKGTLQERLEQIASERKKLDEEESGIIKTFTGLDQIIEGVDFVTGDGIPADLEPIGFTDRIRKILSEASTPLAPTQIRDLLVAQGQLASSSKNLLISVHTVLSRISDEIKKVEWDGKIAFVSKNPKIPTLSPVPTANLNTRLVDRVVGVNVNSAGSLNPNRLNTGRFNK
jgi:hypothetical protein